MPSEVNDFGSEAQLDQGADQPSAIEQLESLLDAHHDNVRERIFGLAISLTAQISDGIRVVVGDNPLSGDHPGVLPSTRFPDGFRVPSTGFAVIIEDVRLEGWVVNEHRDDSFDPGLYSREPDGTVFPVRNAVELAQARHRQADNQQRTARTSDGPRLVDPNESPSVVNDENEPEWRPRRILPEK